MVTAYRPRSLAAALDLLAKHSLTVFNGGTDLMVKYAGGRSALPAVPNDVLFVGHLDELRQLHCDDEWINIGGAVTFAQILAHPQLPLWLKEPIRDLAAPGLRSVATLAGNICNASPAADSLPMLYAAGARLTISSARSSAERPLGECITGPGTTALGRDEMVTAIKIPRRIWNCWRYRKVGQRGANAIAKVSLFAAARLQNAEVAEIVLALGAVAPTVVRSLEAEALLTGKPLAAVADIIPAVLKHVEGRLKTISDIRSSREYRRETALALVETFLRKELDQG